MKIKSNRYIYILHIFVSYWFDFYVKYHQWKYISLIWFLISFMSDSNMIFKVFSLEAIIITNYKKTNIRK